MGDISRFERDFPDSRAFAQSIATQRIGGPHEGAGTLTCRAFDGIYGLFIWAGRYRTHGAVMDLIGLATVQRGALKDSELWHTAAPCLVLRSGLGMEVCVMALMLSEIKTFGGFTEETCDLCNV